LLFTLGFVHLLFTKVNTMKVYRAMAYGFDSTLVLFVWWKWNGITIWFT